MATTDELNPGTRGDRPTGRRDRGLVAERGDASSC